MVPSIPDLRFQKLLAKATMFSPHLSKFASDFLDPDMGNQLSSMLLTLLSTYKPLLLCREHFNLSSSSDLNPGEADYISNTVLSRHPPYIRLHFVLYCYSESDQPHPSISRTSPKWKCFESKATRRSRQPFNPPLLSVHYSSGQDD